MSADELSASAIKSKRIVYLVFATLTLLVLGLIYAWSIFAKPIGVDYPEYKGLLGQVFQVSMFAFCVSALFGAQLIKKTSAKLTIIVAAALLGAGFVLTTVGVSLGIWSLFVFYGILAASGCGIAYNAIISLVNPWFPDRIGLASGIMMMGFGVSSLVFASLANAMFTLVDWQVVFIAIAVVGVIVMVALALVVKPAPKTLGQTLGLSGSAGTIQVTPTQKQSIFKTKVFWLFCIWATIVIACGLTVIGRAAQGADALGVATVTFEGFPALLVGLVSTMNGIGRVINGTVFDKFGLVPVMALAAVCAFIAMALLALSFTVTLPFVYIVGAIVVAFPYSAVPVMASAYARQRYNPADFAKNLGIANCNIAVAATMNIAIAFFLGPIGDLDKVTGAPVNDNIVFAILGVLTLVALGAVFAFAKTYKADLAKIKEELS